MDLHTLSIVAHCPQEGSFGVAVSLARPNVGSLVPFVSLKGAIATQARVNTDLGRKGLADLSDWSRGRKGHTRGRVVITM